MKEDIIIIYQKNILKLKIRYNLLKVIIIIFDSLSLAIKKKQDEVKQASKDMQFHIQHARD